MELHNLNKIKGNKSKRTRIGRGIGSGHGGHTVGKGNKGQKARQGNSIPRGFEGGQVPLYKKLPKIGGFKSLKAAQYVHLNLHDLNSVFTDGDVVSKQTIIKMGLLPNKKYRDIKILNKGSFTKKLTFNGLSFSKSAKEAVTKIGGTINNK